MSKGFTILEAIVATALTAFLLSGLVFGYTSALGTNDRIQASREKTVTQREMEDALIRWLHGARLNTDTSDRLTYFIASSGLPTTTVQVPAQGAPAPQSVSPADNAGSSSDTLTFTSISSKIPAAALESTDDFETMNQNFGPLGGTSEVSVSLTPVGAPSSAPSGLLLRTQTPADGDPTQGGSQSLVLPGVQTLGFELFDGQTWQPGWDTTPSGARTLPGAVRITYQYENDSVQHQMVVNLPTTTTKPASGASL